MENKKQIDSYMDTFLLRVKFKKKDTLTIAGINRNILRLDPIISELETKIDLWEIIRMNALTGKFKVFSSSLPKK